MDNLTSVCKFFENSPKQQKYFEFFLEFYKVDLHLTETKRKEIIGLAKNIHYTKQQYSFLSQSKTEIYMMLCITKTGSGMQKLKSKPKACLLQQSHLNIL